MDPLNLEYLKNQLKYTGFGQSLSDALKENMASRKNQFVLSYHTRYADEQLTASLRFSRSMQSELYFFNSYKATLHKADQSGPSQIFYIGKDGSNITLKEAFNLLSGRSVQKDLITRQGNFYQAWLQLDFKQTLPNGNFKILQFGKNYGYDLFEALKKLPIAEISEQAQRVRILDSLKKGNAVPVTLSGPFAGQKVLIEANPQFKAIIIYDTNHQRLRHWAKKSPQQLSQQQPENNVHSQNKENTSAAQRPKKDSRRKGPSM